MVGDLGISLVPFIMFPEDVIPEQQAEVGEMSGQRRKGMSSMSGSRVAIVCTNMEHTVTSFNWLFKTNIVSWKHPYLDSLSTDKLKYRPQASKVLTAQVE